MYVSKTNKLEIKKMQNHIIYLIRIHSLMLFFITIILFESDNLYYYYT